MSLELTRSALLWCSIINYAILILWALMYLFAHDWMQWKFSRWYRLAGDRFDILNVAGITAYKLAIILFNIVPCIALYIVG